MAALMRALSLPIRTRLLLTALWVLLGGTEPATGQVNLQAGGAAANPQAKGGFLFEERKPLPPATQDILRRVNAIRAAGATCGSRVHEPAPPLEWSETLERTALLHTRDMVARQDLNHTGSDGSDIGQRMQRQGYGWSAAGENIAAGQRSTADAIASWLRSPGHCSNMMNKGFTEMGVTSLASGGSYSAYHTMVLGRPIGGPAGAMVAASDMQDRDPKAVLALVNRVRATGGSCGGKAMPPAPPLAWDERLMQVAQWEAGVTAGHNTGNEGPVPGDFRSRLARVGYLAGRSATMGASGGAAPLPVVQRWLADAGSCDSLLDANFKHLAVAGRNTAPNGQGEAWWWAAVVANSIVGDRLGATGPVDRSRTDVAVVQEVVNAQRAKGATCAGEVFPPVPPVTGDPRVQAIAQTLGTEGGEMGKLLSAAGVPWGGATQVSGFSAHGLVVAIEDFVSGSYCKEFMARNLAYVAGYAKAVGGSTPNYWVVLLVQGR